MGDERARRRQAAIFLAGLILLNAPLLTVADRLSLTIGLPLTPVLVLLAWLAVILMAAANARRRPVRGR